MATSISATCPTVGCIGKIEILRSRSRSHPHLLRRKEIGAMPTASSTDPGTGGSECARITPTPIETYPDNTIVAVPLSGPVSSAGIVLASGHDFYSSPRLSPNGNHLAWLAWDHPNMPWTASTLYMVELDERRHANSQADRNCRRRRGFAVPTGMVARRFGVILCVGPKRLVEYLPI